MWGMYFLIYLKQWIFLLFSVVTIKKKYTNVNSSKLVYSLRTTTTTTTLNHRIGLAITCINCDLKIYLCLFLIFNKNIQFTLNHTFFDAGVKRDLLVCHSITMSRFKPTTSTYITLLTGWGRCGVCIEWVQLILYHGGPDIMTLFLSYETENQTVTQPDRD